MKKELHQVDFCVVGGGMAGLTAAIAAARHGARVALVQDRPVLGGNASSEIRMHICGAHGENHYRNPQPNYSIWDSVLYGKAHYQDNLELLLNCSVNHCDMDGCRIRSVTAWQLTTETWHTIEAGLFADCSGDGILAPLSGARFRIGREARDEYGESIAPQQSDRKTMGMTAPSAGTTMAATPPREAGLNCVGIRLCSSPKPDLCLTAISTASTAHAGMRPATCATTTPSTPIFGMSPKR